MFWNRCTLAAHTALHTFPDSDAASHPSLLQVKKATQFACFSSWCRQGGGGGGGKKKKKKKAVLPSELDSLTQVMSVPIQAMLSSWIIHPPAQLRRHTDIWMESKRMFPPPRLLALHRLTVADKTLLIPAPSKARRGGLKHWNLLGDVEH